MGEHDIPQAKEARKNIGDKHSSVVIARFGSKILLADRTLFVHVKGFFIRKSASWK